MLKSSPPNSDDVVSYLLEMPLPAISQKREQILQGAMQVFMQSGYAETSMDRVAAEAGVSKQTIYSHFQDKEGLFKALMERVTLDRFHTLFCIEGQLSEDSVRKQLSEEPAIVLRQIAETFVGLKSDQEYISLLRVIVGESSRFPELAKLYTRTVIQRGRQLLCRYFDAHPELAMEDSEAMAHIFIGSLVSYILSQEVLHGKETIPMESDRLINSLINLFISQVISQVKSSG
ncbi:MAG: TetR/AcrR family transcriptional regulator [Kovacikia sp.]